MPKQSDSFSVEVVGNGALTGMFFTEFCKRYRSAVCFDRTDPTNQARQNEADFGELPEASPHARAMSLLTQVDLALPQRADITVRFLKMGKMENVAVFCSKSSRTFVFDLSHPRSINQLVGYVLQVVHAVGNAY